MASIIKTGATGFSRIEHALRTNSRHGFQSLVCDLLSGLMPEFAEARVMGELDCLGLDVYAYDPETERETIAVQCKGLERAFEPGHTEMLLKEIGKFEKKGPVVRAYWLVVNRRLPKAERETLRAALDRLVDKGRAEQAELFDLTGFTGHLRDMARKLIGALADERRAGLRADFEQRLRVVNYLPDVPFGASTGEAVGPADWMTQQVRRYLGHIHHDHIGKDRSPPRFLVTASFGFGKTSTLHAAAERWLATGGQVLYVPAALLAERAFVNGAGVTEGLLLVIDPTFEDRHPLVQLLMRETLRKDLARARDWLLVIDAIDENPNWEHLDKLSALWGGIADLGLPLIVSVREELLQLRRQEFERGDGRNFGRPFFEIVPLLDWRADLIEVFLARYEQDRPGPAPRQFGRLRTLVAGGDYEKVYGDIPKRPLFLGMLAQDAWQDVEPEQYLDRLYEAYLRRKLDGDRYSAGAEGRVVRLGPVGRRLSAEELTERLMRMMGLVAGRMLGVEGRDPSPLLGEGLLELAGEEVGIAFEQVEELVLNSVLQPAGRNRQTGSRLFRFAHQSFQDWFAAAHLVRSGAELDTVTGVTEGTRSFARLMAARDRRADA